MSHQLQYRITTKAPLLLSKIIGETSIVDTMDYILGSAVIGMLANRYIKDHQLGNNAHQADRFFRWFLNGDLTFSNAFIETSFSLEDGNINTLTLFPTPLSIREDKRTSQVYDFLFQPEDPSIRTRRMPPYATISSGIIYTGPVDTSLHFHHSRDETRGAPEEGLFFNYESIDPGQSFRGIIRGTESELNEFLDEFGKSFPGDLGRSKNAQYGRIEFQILSNAPEKIIFDDKILDQTALSLTLLSNGIFYDHNGFPTTDTKIIAEKYFQAEITKSFIKDDQVENFISVWRLRKPSERCLLAGSCFLVKVNQQNRNHLKQLAEYGVGERIHEGFGQLRLGWQTEPRLTEYPHREHKPQFTRPATAIPEISRRVAVNVIHQWMIRQVELNALQEAQAFHTYPPKSLIGRLEAFAKEQNIDKKNFQEKIRKLRNTAKDRLEACRRIKPAQTLERYLMKLHITPQMLLAIQEPETAEDKEDKLKMQELIQAIQYDPSQDAGFPNLFQLHLQTFFSMMRKLHKIQP